MSSVAMVFPVRYVSDGLAVQTTSRELTPLGIWVRSLQPPAVGARVSMALYLPGAKLPDVAVARVSRISGGTPSETGFWADFMVLDTDARIRITDLVSGRSLNAESHRAFERYPVQLKVRFRTASEFAIEHASNLSRGGVFIRCENPPEVNEPVEVQIELPDGELVSSTGVVVHRSPPGKRIPSGVGVQFIGAADRFRERLDRYMDTLSSGGPVPQVRRDAVG